MNTLENKLWMSRGSFLADSSSLAEESGGCVAVGEDEFVALSRGIGASKGFDGT